MPAQQTIVILSITSDIGNYLAQQYASRGWQVIGTYRTPQHLHNLPNQHYYHLIKCDVTKKADITKLYTQLKTKRIKWNRLISCVGNLLPAKPFFQSKFDEWEDGVGINALGQLHVVHSLYPLRSKNAQVVFFAGGGVNKAVTDITAYTASKMMLTKMVEYLDAENKDMTFMIVGPGLTQTKIHDDILKSKGVSAAKAKQTKQDLKNKPTTSLEDIDSYINWLCTQPKSIVSGRNFSVVFDPWKGNKAPQLARRLKSNSDMYKLRRMENL